MSELPLERQGSLPVAGLELRETLLESRRITGLVGREDLAPRSPGRR